MKKLIITIIVILLFLSACTKGKEEGYFRNSTWGMSVEEVKKSETIKEIAKDVNNHHGNDSYGMKYVGQVGDFEADIKYGFDGQSDQLDSGEYFFRFLKSEYSNPFKKMNEAAGMFKEELIDKYGKPLATREAKYEITELLWETNRSFIILSYVSSETDLYDNNYLVQVFYLEKEKYKDYSIVNRILSDE